MGVSLPAGRKGGEATVGEHWQNLPWEPRQEGTSRMERSQQSHMLLEGWAATGTEVTMKWVE